MRKQILKRVIHFYEQIIAVMRPYISKKNNSLKVYKRRFLIALVVTPDNYTGKCPYALNINFDLSHPKVADEN